MNHVCFNGTLIPEGEPVLAPGNKSYRYGDGLFETVKIHRGKILLEAYHLDRLFTGMDMMQFNIPGDFNADNLRSQILKLAEMNQANTLGRIRISVSRGNGGLYDDSEMQWLIESFPLDESFNKLNVEGLQIGIYPDAKKVCDVFSNLKSCNFLPYVMAARHARECKLDDCLVLNTDGHIADSTKCNLFLIKDGVIFTPALSQGCVNGVMRRWLLEILTASGYTVKEIQLSHYALESANELFLSNAIHGIRWVKQCEGNNYTNEITTSIYQKLVAPLFF